MKKSEGLKTLEALVNDIKRKKYPLLPAHAMTPARYTDKTANGLTKAILDYLKANNFKAWRQSSEGRYRPGKTVIDVIGRTRLMKGNYLSGSNKGHADISAIIRGQFIAWEIKIGKDRQSNFQQLFQQQIEQSGGKYFLVGSFEQFLQQYKSII